MKTRWLLSVGLAAMGLCRLAVRAADVSLATGGKAEAVIVVAKYADKAARFAAADLKWHLDSITGGDFRIVTDYELACFCHIFKVEPQELLGDFAANYLD